MAGFYCLTLPTKPRTIEQQQTQLQQIGMWLKISSLNLQLLEMIANDSLTVRIRTFNFPGWTAYINGIPALIKSEDGTKAMLVDVPKGEHFLKLNFKDTPIRIIGNSITFVIYYFISSFTAA